ncbi:hypothetical protein HNQ02_003628 [Flavobacterium sp. 7E]|uniref:hypothetical protein n=1 Tax=Flavobacterium sp. 7E TaxID=2735898 RepID=UPI001570A133|nr:hypothetical protein [Flavobacterium sp. 7E]NRS90681.1 hypothetical protein [Flavobacterium sp. 7E]
MNKILLWLLVFLFFNSCGPKLPRYTDTAFKQYLIDTNKMDKDAAINDSYYDKYYLKYLYDTEKKHILGNPYLKANQVYTYLKSNGNSYIFSVFADDGQLYTGTYFVDNEYLSAPENGIIKIKQHLKLSSLGDFEVTDSIIEISRNIKTAFREWDENDTGYVKNDTIHLTASYIAKRYGYEKKWWAKKHKTHFIHAYQPKLKAGKIKDPQFGYDVFIVTGEFNAYTRN